MWGGELVFYAIFQPCLVIYGGQFPQLEEQSGEGRVVWKRDALTTRPRKPLGRLCCKNVSIILSKCVFYSILVFVYLMFCVSFHNVHEHLNNPKQELSLFKLLIKRKRFHHNISMTLKTICSGTSALIFRNNNDRNEYLLYIIEYI